MVRKALNLAVDRDGLVHLLNGLAVPAITTVTPKSSWLGNPSFKIKFDPAEARRMLKEAGYDDAHRLKFKAAISTSGSGQMYPLIINEFIQQNLADGGVDMEVEVFEWNALTARSRAGAAAPENKSLSALNSSWNTMEAYNAFIR